MENVCNPEQYIPAVLRKCKTSHVERTYEVKGWSNSAEFLELLARKGGRLLKGGEPDLDGVAKIVLNDFMRGKLPWFTPCPKPEATEEEKQGEREARFGETNSKKKKEEMIEDKYGEKVGNGQEYEKDGEQGDFEEWGGFGDEESTVVGSEGSVHMEGDEGDWEDNSEGEKNGEVDAEAGASDASDTDGIDVIEIDEEEMARLAFEAQEESRKMQLGQLSTSAASSGHRNKRAKLS